MLFVIFVIAFVAGIVLMVFEYNTTDTMFGLALTAVSTVAVSASCVLLLFTYCGIDGVVASDHARREMLVWQWENKVYENDNDIGKRDLIKDIQSWNEDLAAGKANQYDFWIGIFVPNVFDQFEFIELNETTE